jgi:heterodisulfide reductase subunit C
MDGNYKKEGPGVFRKISNETLDELKEIFKVTGGADLYQKIEDFSEIKAAEMGIEFGPGTDNDYFRHTYFSNNGEHTREE